MTLYFTVYCKPEPQGSTRAFMRKGMKFPVVTSDNKNLKSFRQEVSLAAIAAMKQSGYSPISRKIPVRLEAKFFFLRPASKSKKAEMTVKPDLDKVARSVADSLTGICYEDDSQIASASLSKEYGEPERVEISVYNG